MRRASRPSIRKAAIDWVGGLDVVRACTFILVVVSFSSIHMYLGPLRLLRPGMLFLVIPLGALILKPQLGKWANLGTFGSKAVLAFFLIACASGPFGLSVGTTFRLITGVYYLNIVLFVLLIVGLRDVRDLGLLLWAYVASIGVIVILSLTVLEMAVTYQGLARLEGGMGMYDANDLGMIVLMALPLCLLFFFNSGKIGRMVSMAMLLGIPTTIALTGSRGAMLGLVIVGGMLMVGLRRVSAPKKGGILVAVIAGLFVSAPAGYWDQMQTILDPSDDYNVSSEYGRIPLAKRGVGYMLKYPIFGLGAGNFNRAEGTISPIARSRISRGMSVEWIAPHNTYTQVGAEMGVMALAIWLTMLYRGSIGLWKLRRRIPVTWEQQSRERKLLREICLFLPFTFVAFATTSFFLSHAYTAVPYVLFAMLVGTEMLVKRELAIDARGGMPSPGRRAGNGRQASNGRQVASGRKQFRGIRRRPAPMRAR